MADLRALYIVASVLHSDPPVDEANAVLTLLGSTAFTAQALLGLSVLLYGLMMATSSDYPDGSLAMTARAWWQPSGVLRRLHIVPYTRPLADKGSSSLVNCASSRDEGGERVVSLGATVVADHRRPDGMGWDGMGWVTLADIEGNEFCIERSAAERAS